MPDITQGLNLDNSEPQTGTPSGGDSWSEQQPNGSVSVNASQPAPQWSEQQPNGNVSVSTTNPTPRAGIEVDKATSQPVAPNAAQNVQNFSQQNQPSVQTDGQQQKLKSQAKQNPASLLPPTPPPVVQKASWVHDIAQTLAGGPRYDYKVDPNTGEMQKTAIPVSKAHLGMALALQFLQGAGTSLAAGKGAGNAGKGYAAAMAQGVNQVKQQQGQDQQKAQDAYVRSAQIAKTNMEMMRNEQVGAQADEALQEKDIDGYADELAEAQKVGAVKESRLSWDDIQSRMKKDLNITKDMLIPDGVRAMTGPDGKPILTPHGVPKFEKTYSLIDPISEINAPPDLIKKAQDLNLPGFVKYDKDGNTVPVDLPSDMKMRLHMVSGLQENVRQYDLADAGAQGFNDGNKHALNSDTHPSSEYQQTSQQTPVPALKDATFAPIADKAAETHNIPQALFRAIASQEGGSITTPNSKPNSKGTYAVGPMQVTLGTAKSVTGNNDLTEADLKNPNTNANISAKLIRNLLDVHDGNVHDTLVAYHGAGADSLGETGESYAKKIMTKIPGLLNVNANGESPQVNTKSVEDDLQKTIGPRPTAMSSRDAIQKKIITPGDMSTLSKMGSLATLLDGKYTTKDVQLLGEKLKQDPASVGRIINAWGGAIDYANKLDEAQQLQIKGGAAVQKAADIQTEKDSQNQKEADTISSFLRVPDGYTTEMARGNVFLSPQDLQAKLESQGAKVPPELAFIQSVMKNQADPKDAPQKLYAHQIKMNTQDIIDWGKKFINPDYDQSDWTGKEAFQKQLASANPTGLGGQFLSADKLGQHLSVLNDAADGLSNGNLRSINDVKNYLAKQFGGSSKDAFENTSRIVQTEVAKFVSGGTPTQGEIEAMEKNLDAASSPAQIKAVIDNEVSLISGAYNSLTNKVNDYFQYDPLNKRVKPTQQSAKLFGERGLFVPGYGSPTYDPKNPNKVTGLATKDPITGKNVYTAKIDPKTGKWQFAY